MFTGLIQQQARVLANNEMESGNRLFLSTTLSAPEVGESIAVNGVCLTLLPGVEGHLAFDVSPETLKLTTLGQLRAGHQVNIERALLASSRLGGHYVSGHVDTTASLKAMTALGDYLEIHIGDFAMPASRYLLPKGSITLDGVSLTINTVDTTGIKLMMIPHTLAHTTFGQLKIGQRLNVEFDYFTRIVAHQLTISGQLNSEVEL
ncbi:MAG: riboflavin synthase [Legionella sp.]|nr:riboflavin synthase [Legionella sp.]